MTAVTKAEFARHIGRSPGRISQYIKAGLPVRWDGTIDTVAGEAWVLANVGARTHRGPNQVRIDSEPPKQARTHLVNKAEACRHFQMTRGEFDRLVLEGMPVMSAPRNRGGEYVVDLEAADDWLIERETARHEARRRYREAEEARRQENQRILARMSEEQRRKLLPRWARGR
jgi:phage terminase Nu1 subunit (DNA packaging protein)